MKNVSFASQKHLSEYENATARLRKKTLPDVVVADNCEPLNVTNHRHPEAMLRSWGVLPGCRFSLPGGSAGSALAPEHGGDRTLWAMYLRGLQQPLWVSQARMSWQQGAQQTLPSTLRN